MRRHYHGRFTRGSCDCLPYVKLPNYRIGEIFFFSALDPRWIQVTYVVERSLPVPCPVPKCRSAEPRLFAREKKRILPVVSQSLKEAVDPETTRRATHVSASNKTRTRRRRRWREGWASRTGCTRRPVARPGAARRPPRWVGHRHRRRRMGTTGVSVGAGVARCLHRALGASPRASPRPLPSMPASRPRACDAG